MSNTNAPRTMFEKIWDAHVVHAEEGRQTILYIDRHLVHEVTSAQAFEGLRLAGRTVRQPELVVATPDHNIPTTDRLLPIADEIARKQVDTLRSNCQEFDIRMYDLNDPQQGIVHIIGPELGYTQPGMTIVCGDSHTSTHGAFGALAFGIGTSEVEHVLATQTLLLRKSKSMEVRIEGEARLGVTAKDVILAVIRRIGAAGGTGHVIEYTGDYIRGASMESRLTICNMSIEAGARAGLVAPDETTFAYLHGRPMAPQGEDWDRAVAYWRTLRSDADATYDKVVTIDVGDIAPNVTWGTSPEDVIAITDTVPAPDSFADPAKQVAARKSLDYMGLTPGMAATDIAVQNIFIGSCTNGTLADLRAAATILKGRRIAPNVRQALVVPGSGMVKEAAEAEGLDRIFLDAGFEWREPGCSMCLGMNPDKVPAGEHCASTSNRNFVGRQGPGARTHLVSPPMAAAAAIAGRLADVREYLD